VTAAPGGRSEIYAGILREKIRNLQHWRRWGEMEEVEDEGIH